MTIARVDVEIITLKERRKRTNAPRREIKSINVGLSSILVTKLRPAYTYSERNVDRTIVFDVVRGKTLKFLLANRPNYPKREFHPVAERLNVRFE